MIAAVVAALLTVAQADSVVVDARHSGADGARVRGTPVYRTIAPALRAAPASSRKPFELHIRNGRYYEKLIVDKPNVHFIGQQRDSTILTYDAAAGHKSPSGEEWGTRGSFTLRVTAPGFQLENMTVENGFDYMSNYRKPNNDSTKLVGAQGVAVMLAEGSDRAVLRRCNIVGHQDTLFPDAGRSYFSECTISGSVDFIFGAGQAVFENVDIISRDRGSRTNNGYITAASTPIGQPIGFVFIDCRLKKESPAMAAGTVSLGRPWHPGGDPNAVGNAVFVGCWMDDHIAAKGWESMYSTSAAGVRTLHVPEEARFFEAKSEGPGALRSATRKWLSDGEALGVIDRVVALYGWPAERRSNVKASSLPAAPRLHTYRAELLAESKQRLRTKDPKLTPALAKLVADADSVFKTGPYTVTAKERTPPSGDKRDYLSFAPYWWPDPTKPDGLPYIQRDGQFNMELRRDSDVLRWYAMTDAVETLAHAWYFTDRPEYAHRAAHLLRVWFLNDSTRMNPHLKYAQAIPGRTEGRGIGIIDTRDLGRLFDAIALLEGSSAWSESDARGLREWAAQYLDWLLTSQHGKDEAAATNNHGTWYDVQIAALALFVGDTARARAIFESAKTQRIAKQIDAGGKQPLELARTRSLHYSVENLDGFTRLAEMARTLGIDLWNWSSRESGGIRKAIAFVRPYSDPKLKWPHEQITEEPADMFVLLLRRADAAFKQRGPDGIPADIVRAHRGQLLYPESR